MTIKQAQNRKYKTLVAINKEIKQSGHNTQKLKDLESNENTLSAMIKLLESSENLEKQLIDV